MTETDITMTGEARLRKRRNAWWRYLGIAFVASALAGFFGGYFVDAYQEGRLPLWVPVVTVVAALIALAWFTRDYFRRVDELDLMDNLWAHLIGLYGGMITFMGWYFFAELSLVAYPSALAAIALMWFFTFAAYGIRKLGFR